MDVDIIFVVWCAQYEKCSEFAYFRLFRFQSSFALSFSFSAFLSPWADIQWPNDTTIIAGTAPTDYLKRMRLAILLSGLRRIY